MADMKRRTLFKGLAAAAAAVGLGKNVLAEEAGPTCKTCGDTGRIVEQEALRWQTISWEDDPAGFPAPARIEYTEKPCPACKPRVSLGPFITTTAT